MKIAMSLPLFYSLKLVLLSATLSSCGLLPPKQVHFYDGPQKPTEQLAVLAESNASKARGGNYGTHVTHINGERIKPILGGRYIDAIYVIPGEYEFTFSYFAPSHDAKIMDMAKGKAVVRLNASHRYIPNMRLDGDDTQAQFGLFDMGDAYPIDCLRSSPYHPKPDNCAVPGSLFHYWYKYERPSSREIVD